MNAWHASRPLLLGLVLLLAGCSLTPRATVSDDGETPDSYLVVRGDTLYSIAWRYSLDYRDIAVWNQISNPHRILAGQRLRLRPPDGEAAPPRLAGIELQSHSEPDSGPPRAAGKPAPAASGKTSKTSKTDKTGKKRPAAVAANPAPPASDERNEARPTSESRPSGRQSWVWPTDGRIVRGFDPATPGRKGIQIGGDAGQAIRATAGGQVVYSGSGLPGYGTLIIVQHSEEYLSAYGHLNRTLVREGDSVAGGQAIAEMGIGSENRPVLHFEVRRNGKPVDPTRLVSG